MTVICSNLLNQTVIDNKIDKPAAILLEVDKLLNMTLKQNADAFHGVQDGMDISLLRVNKAKKEIVITSAKRPVLFIRNNEVRDMKGSRFSLGGMKTSGEKNFEEISINYQAGDILYFFTDGYHDQFGGENGKKFSSKRLKDLLFKIHQLGIDEQKKKLDDEMKEWMGNLEQVDDMCVIGIRFT
jgi:serine phosphatase RsbU (regulator of sigma subunit)